MIRGICQKRSLTTNAWKHCPSWIKSPLLHFLRFRSFVWVEVFRKAHTGSSIVLETRVYCNAARLFVSSTEPANSAACTPPLSPKVSSARTSLQLTMTGLLPLFLPTLVFVQPGRLTSAICTHRWWLSYGQAVVWVCWLDKRLSMLKSNHNDLLLIVQLVSKACKAKLTLIASFIAHSSKVLASTQKECLEIQFWGRRPVGDADCFVWLVWLFREDPRGINPPFGKTHSHLAEEACWMK